MTSAPHIPVLLDEVIAAASPVEGVWLDGTLGAGGYTRALLDAGAEHVIGVDRDPEAGRQADIWASGYGPRFTFVNGEFSRLDRIAEEAGFPDLDGVVLDIGVSSMQIDDAQRGFSFMKDGPLDMRMSGQGPSAADIVNAMGEADLADLLFQYGEERASRRIARAILKARAEAPIETTGRLAAIVSPVLPRPRPGQPHPATRSFQALRIAVNAELRELVEGLLAAERGLAPDGRLIVVTFHSLEDRIVKRFFQLRSGRTANPSRHAPQAKSDAPTFEMITRKAVTPSEAEIARNPRARSAKLRAGRRLAAEPTPLDTGKLGLPRRDYDAMGRVIQ